MIFKMWRSGMQVLRASTDRPEEARKPTEIVKPQVSEDIRLYFHQVPKCASTSVRIAVNQLFSPQYYAHLNSVSSKAQADLLLSEVQRHREHVLAHLLDQKHLRGVSGHFVWSDRVHGQFLNDKPGGWSSMTLLRHPVDRWFSHYFFDRFKKSEHFRIEEDLEEFLESDRAQRMGKELGMYFIDIRSHTKNPANYNVRTAVKNLERFTLVGIVEDIPGFCRGFENKFGAPLTIGCENENPAPDAKSVAMKDTYIRQRVEILCSQDLEFYEAARAIAARHLLN